MKYYIVDAFSDRLFGGNPAGVCILTEPLSAAVMQRIAFENNLSETAFVLKREGYYDLKWFTPETEIDLCGHATLASAFILMNYDETGSSSIDFETLSGKLTVRRDGNAYVMRFPSRKPSPCPKPDILEEALGVPVLETHRARDLLVLLECESDVLHLTPDLNKLGQIDDVFAVIVTAKGEHCDFVSRFFAPNAGIPEDPVTGSSHTTLIPFWSNRLGNKTMSARQLSKRGGVLTCCDCGDFVEIGGQAVLYLEGEIKL